MILSQKDESKFILYEVKYDRVMDGPMYMPVGEQDIKVLCVGIPNLSLTACYIDTRTDLRSSDQTVKLMNTRLQYGPDLFAYNLDNSLDVMNELWECDNQPIQPEPAAIKYIKSALDGSEKLPHSKVSSRHLRHVTFHELDQIPITLFCKMAGPIITFIYNYRNDLDFTEPFAIGMLVWALNLKGELSHYILRSRVWLRRFNSLALHLAYFKREITLKLKALQNCLPIDLSQAFEFEVLVNRGIGQVDWDKEKQNRTKPELCNIPSQEVYTRALDIFSEVRRTGRRPKKQNWDSFWKTRWKWAPTGSYFSQYPEDDVYKAKDTTLRSKMFGLSAMGTRTFNDFFSRTPELQAKAMTKYEWGKQRAIYSVDITNFILGQHALGDCESLLAAIFPLAENASAEAVANSVEEVLRNGQPYCFDFEDFNSQHSITNMQMVLTAYLQVFQGWMSDTQVEALNWQIASLESTWVRREGEEPFLCAGTLLSGWRLTTFMNTILNKIYIDTCVDPLPLVSLHNGDDVLAAVTSFYQIQQLSLGAKKYNIRFQPTKCFFSSIAEFLRVDHATKTGTQYLARAIATFVHAPVEAVIPNDLTSVLKSQLNRVNEVMARGGSKKIMDHIRLRQRTFISKLWNIDPKELVKVEETHVSLGGLSEEIAPNTLKWYIKRKLLYRPYDPGGKIEQDVKSTLPGTYDYAHYIGTKFGLTDYIPKIAKRAREAIFSLTVANRYSVEVVPVTQVNIHPVMHANQYRMFRGMVDNGKTLLAKAFKIPLHEFVDGMSMVVESIRYDLDPLLTLANWT